MIFGMVIGLVATTYAIPGEPCTDDAECDANEKCCDDFCLFIECNGNFDCDDGEACTIDFCSGEGLCYSQCMHIPITYCLDGDGCCPEGCNELTDLDCINPCGNGICDVDETWETCPEDCTCGNGVCDEGETWETCPEDCTCGNGICEVSETPETCPVDCINPCGNSVCGGILEAEDCSTCPQDCLCIGDLCKQGCCGDGICANKESFEQCPVDCPEPISTCGNDICDNGETSETCLEDCPPEIQSCGDGFCGGVFQNENCASCPEDCGFIGKDGKHGCCGDGICSKKEDITFCFIDCADI